MAFLHLLVDPWGSDIARSALIEVVLLGAIGGPVGFWAARERLTYGAESLAHGLLPGLVVAALVSLPLMAGAAGGAAVAAAAIAVCGRDERIGPETGTGVAVAGLLGLGALLALAPDAPPRLEELLFGDPLAASGGDLIAAAALAIGGGAALAVLHRPLCATVFDPAGASALGMRPTLVRLALLVLLAASVAVAARGLGSLLALAVLAAPAVAARHASSPARAIGLAAAVGAGAGVVGIYVSFHLDVAAGGAVALALCGAAVLPLSGRRRGAPGPA
ncbi:MAG: metal ABC transporter permease [Thermoleophilaceae bacterium]